MKKTDVNIDINLLTSVFYWKPMLNLHFKLYLTRSISLALPSSPFTLSRSLLLCVPFRALFSIALLTLKVVVLHCTEDCDRYISSTCVVLSKVVVLPFVLGLFLEPLVKLRSFFGFWCKDWRIGGHLRYIWLVVRGVCGLLRYISPEVQSRRHCRCCVRGKLHVFIVSLCFRVRGVCGLSSYRLLVSFLNSYYY